MNERQGFIAELVRRKVVRVGITYIAIAWLLIQVADVALDSFGAPGYFMQAFMLFAILGLPVVLILTWMLEVTPEGILLDSAALARANLRTAIAVLPFSNMSSDVEVEHLADGLTDHLITECQNSLAIPVTSRNSTFVYKNQPIAIPVAARELNVSYILEGSIQKQGEKVRVTAQLIRGIDDSHLWADSFDKVLGDAFALQDELTNDIVSALGSALSTVEEPATESEETLVERILRLPAYLTVSLGGILILGSVLALSLFAPGTLDWSGSISTSGLFWLGGLILAASLAGMFAFFWLQGRQKKLNVINEILPQIDQHVADGHFHEAFDLAVVNKALLPASLDETWWDTFSMPSSIACDLPGAVIRYRPYNGRNVDWRDIEPPFRDARLPLGNVQLTISAPGFVTQEFCTANPGVLLNNHERIRQFDPEILELATHIRLASERDAVAGMVHAWERPIFIALVGLPAPPDPIFVPAFDIDRYPVTNAEFEAFVTEGGYANHALWENLPWPEDVSWQDALKQFVDATGRPGPADWELGKPPNDEASLPVTGVSWFEAAAYANSRGKSLPTVWQWARAALPFDSNVSTINVAMMRFSNFFGQGKSRPGEYPSMNGVGTYDMFGNVREWTLNEVGDGRGNVGGCHSDEPYYGVWLNKDDAMTRSPETGFRCVKCGEQDEFQTSPVRRTDRSYDGESPISDEAYEAMIQSIIPTPKPTQYALVNESTMDANTRNTYLLDSGYGEKFHLVAVYPQDQKGALIVFPGMGAFFGGERDEDVDGFSQRMSFLTDQLGYSLVFPSFTGMYDRFDGGPFPRGDFRQIWNTRVHHWTQEMTQAIEFIKEHPAFNDEQIGFMGVSYGAIFSTAAVAQHPQFKTLILLSGNMQVTSMVPIADSINYYPRITAPTLMMNGRFDSIVSPEQTLLDLRYELLGTPEEHKRQILYDAGHFPYPQHLFKKDLSDWLQKYL